ncbi:MAG TPA: hypothetical protein VI521_00220 [Candidatus Babeliales bacterium]|nr:hypothetical protein [Candidatus Babeliales bacterium]
MRTYIVVLACMGLSFGNVQLEAITLRSRLRNMAGWAAVTSVAWYGFQVKDETRYMPGMVQTNPLQWTWTSHAHEKAAQGSILPAALTAAWVGWITSYYTPEYRFKWASSERATISKSILFNYQVTEANIKEISIASGAESTGLPLVTLFLTLCHIDKTLGYLIDELEIASSEVRAHSSLSAKISRLLDDLYTDRVRIRESSHTVKNLDTKSWQKQWEIHNSNQMQEKQLAAMYQIANKPQMHLQHHSQGMDGLATSMIAHALMI